MGVHIKARHVLSSSFNWVTVKVAEDYEEPPRKGNQSKRRLWLRACLTLLLVIVLLVVLVLFFTVAAPAVRVSRIENAEAMQHLIKNELTFNSSMQNWHCPCSTQQSYSDFLAVKFVQSATTELLDIAADGHLDLGAGTPFLNASMDTCSALRAGCAWFQQDGDDNYIDFNVATGACRSLLAASLTPAMTRLSFNYVPSPSIVQQAAASQAQALMVAAKSYVMYPQSPTWYCIENWMTVLTFAWGVVLNNPNMPAVGMVWHGHNQVTPSGLLYDKVFSIPVLNSSHPCDAQDCYQPVMPVIVFNWTAFLSSCNVLYCDVTERPSLAYKAVVTFSQIGGILTIALVAVRTFVWPALTWLLLSPSKALPDMLPTSQNSGSSMGLVPIGQERSTTGLH